MSDKMAGERHVASSVTVGQARRRSGSRWQAASGARTTTRESEEREPSAFSPAGISTVSPRGPSWLDEFWPHPGIPSTPGSHITGTGSSGSRSSSSSSNISARFFRLARNGNSGANRFAVGEGVRARVGEGDDHRGLVFPVIDSEGVGRSTSSEHCLETPESLFQGMLPGVEVARRRRVRVAEMHEAGGRGFGAGYDAGNSSRYFRSTVTVAHHHHHHHHHHHQTTRNPPRPGTPRPGSGSHVRRLVMQDILQEHRPRTPFQQTSSSSLDRVSVADGSVNRNSGAHHRSSRGQGHSRSDGESRSTPLSSLWRRQSSDSTLRGAALEARNRLDERLRAAARASQSHRPGWQAAQSPYGMNLFSDEEDESPWSDDDGWETSFQEWLAAWAPMAFEERWGRVGSGSSSRASSSSRNLSFKPRPSEGLSKAAINALPIQLVGEAGTQAAGTRSKLEQEECPVCLERFLTGQYFMALPCNHRFHPECLTPWLSSHGQCPYCRADIVRENDMAEQKSSDTVRGGNDRDLLSWVEAIERGMDRRSYS